MLGSDPNMGRAHEAITPQNLGHHSASGHSPKVACLLATPGRCWIDGSTPPYLRAGLRRQVGRARAL